MGKLTFSSTSYLDFHTHERKHNGAENVNEIVSLDYKSSDEGTGLFTASIHPWDISKILSEEDLSNIASAFKNPYCIGLGEVGLDKLRGPNIKLQLAVLEQVFSIPTNLPVIIHCVKSYDEIIELKKKYSGERKWCLHGFNKNSELAEQLIKLGFYLSIGISTIAYKPELVKNIPTDRLFLETDDDQNTSIISLYEQVSELKNLNIEDLKSHIIDNASKFFA